MSEYCKCITRRTFHFPVCSNCKKEMEPSYVEGLRQIIKELEQENAKLTRIKAKRSRLIGELVREGRRVVDDQHYSIGKMNEANKRAQELEDENAKLRGKWFEKGRSAERLKRNTSGCACEFDSDGETLLTVCAAHGYWRDQQFARLQEATEVLEAAVDLLEQVLTKTTSPQRSPQSPEHKP